MDAQRRHGFRVAAERVDHLAVLLHLPDEDVSEEGRRDEVLELLRDDQVRYVIFIGGQALVLEE